MRNSGSLARFLRRHKIALVGLLLGVIVLQITQNFSGSGKYTFQQSSTASNGGKGSTIQLAGLRGSELILPKDYNESSTVPLLINLHGYTGSGPSQSAYTFLQEAAFDSGLAYIAPTGLKDNLGNNYWNATKACCDFNLSKVDDVAFIDSLIESAVKAANIDPNHIYLFGHSNGHFMAYAYLCSGSTKVAAVAGIAGAMDPDPKTCRAAQNNVLHIHGEKDGTILYNGGALFGNQYSSVASTIDQWKKINGCTAGTSSEIDLLQSISGNDAVRTPFDCRKGALELWSLPLGVHTPALDIDFANKVIAWLRQY